MIVNIFFIGGEVKRYSGVTKLSYYNGSLMVKDGVGVDYHDMNMVDLIRVNEGQEVE